MRSHIIIADFEANINALGKNVTGSNSREIDFIATSGGKKTYIQSAYALPIEEKAETENKPFSLTGDSFPKIIVRHDICKRWYDDNVILNIGIIDGERVDFGLKTGYN